MAIEFKCDCGKQYRVGEETAGRHVQCRACGRRLTIPPAPRPDPSEALLDDNLLSAAAEMERQAATRPAPPVVPMLPPLPSQQWSQPAESPRRQTRYVPPKKQPKTRSSGGGVSLGRRGAQFFVLLSVVGAGFKVYNTLAGKRAPSSGGSPTAVSANASRSAVPVASQSPISAVSTPRPSMTPVQGVQRGEFTVQGDSGPQKVWVYLPASGPANPKSLPCVMVAAAGGTAVSGVLLGEGDVAEHVPYVKAGFSVVAYDVAGDVDALGNPEPAIRAFMRADAGLRDAERARVNAVALFPEIDPQRIYAAGHSSAATIALLLAARNPAIKGVAAYAPAASPGSDLDAETLREIESVFPDFKRFLETHSPANCRPVCPVLLVHSRADEVLPYDGSYRYASANSDQVSLVTLEQGGHYDSMIGEGMRSGVAWLRTKAGLGAQAIAPEQPADAASAAKPAVPAPSPEPVVSAQPSAPAVAPVPEQTASAPEKTTPAPSATPVPARRWKTGEYAEVLDKGEWRKSKILQVRGNEYRIHYVGWGDNWDEWVGPSQIRPLPETEVAVAGPWKQGDTIEVIDNGFWRKSKVLRVRGKEYFIHYEGMHNHWDEWVEPDRTRALRGATPAVAAPGSAPEAEPAVAGPWKQGDIIEVLDHTVWRKSKVLRVRGNFEYFIHYEGWSDSWDEWVKPDRTRPLKSP